MLVQGAREVDVDRPFAEPPRAPDAPEAVVVAAREDHLERQRRRRLEDREVRPRGRGPRRLVHLDDEVRDHVLGPRGPGVELHDRECGAHLGGAAADRAAGAPVRGVGEERRDGVEVAGVERLGVGVHEVGDGVAARHRRWTAGRGSE
jgi:hypothetical protein